MNDHYQKNSVNIEIIDVIYDAPFSIGNVLKYMIRYGDKDEKGKELEKITYYLNLCKKNLEEEPAAIYNWWSDNWKLVKVFSPILKRKGFYFSTILDEFINANLENL